MPGNGLKWKGAKGLEPSTYGLGNNPDGDDARHRSPADAAEPESPCGFAASRAAAIPHGSVGVLRGVCGMNVARNADRDWLSVMAGGLRNLHLDVEAPLRPTD